MSPSRDIEVQHAQVQARSSGAAWRTPRARAASTRRQKMRRESWLYNLYTGLQAPRAKILKNLQRAAILHQARAPQATSRRPCRRAHALRCPAPCPRKFATPAAARRTPAPATSERQRLTAGCTELTACLPKVSPAPAECSVQSPQTPRSMRICRWPGVISPSLRPTSAGRALRQRCSPCCRSPEPQQYALTPCKVPSSLRRPK